MEKKRLTYLLERHLAVTATATEQQELTALLQADTNQELFNSVLADMMQQETPALPANTELWQKMVLDIVAIDKPSAVPVKVVPGKMVRLYRWAAAAAVLLLIGTAVYFFSNRSGQPDLAGTEKTMPPLPITPVDKNVLILPDGSQILLDDIKNGPITTLGHTTITKHDHQIIYSSTGADDAAGYHVIATTRGREYEVVLTDGSHVWLNAASSIRFPTVFTGAQREVNLSGEAWFDVEHADKLPFLVHSNTLTTSVLGTAFDIKDYPGEKNKVVAVQRGKVQVASGTILLATLVKGQQVKVISDSMFHQQPVDTSVIAAWRQGDLIYRDETFETIITDLQRVFRDSVIIKNKDLKDILTTAVFNKRIGIKQSLEIICNITDSRLTRKDGVYIIE